MKEKVGIQNSALTAQPFTYYAASHLPVEGGYYDTNPLDTSNRWVKNWSPTLSSKLFAHIECGCVDSLRFQKNNLSMR